MKSILLFMTFALTVAPACRASNIVVVYPGGSKSHLIAVMPIVEEMAYRGHNITLVTSFKVPHSDSVHDIFLAEVAARIDAFSPDWFGMSKQGLSQIFTMTSRLKSLFIESYELMTANPDFQSLIINALLKKDIDLFLVDAMFADFIFPIIDGLKVPFVLHYSNSGFAMMLKPMGVSMDYASIPAITTEFDDGMSFMQRVINAVQSEMVILFGKQFIMWPLEERIRRDIPGARSLTELRGEASLLLLNSDPITYWPRSLPPSVIPIGALHTRKAKKLSEEFQTFADEAEDGFIVFTLGSLVSVSEMPEEDLKAFLKAFAKLPQKVIWKWESEIPPNLPPNIMMTKWLPQQDLLGHKNAKVFITHGGLLGFQEAIFHAVPLLILPFGNDQKANAAKARREGVGLKLDWGSLDETNVFNAVNRLINDSGFQGNATRLSRLMRDELMPAKDIGAYWIEHILRHKGGKHLQLAGKDIPFHQRYLLDVIAFLIGIIAMFLISLGVILRRVWSRYFRRAPASTEKLKIPQTVSKKVKNRKKQL